MSHQNNVLPNFIVSPWEFIVINNKPIGKYLKINDLLNIKLCEVKCYEFKIKGKDK